MTAGPAKSMPGGVPRAPEELADTVRRAAEGDVVRDELRVSLDVEGGHGDERYELHLEASGAGLARVSLTDALAGRRVEPKQARVAARDLRALLGSIDIRSLIDASGVHTQIPPGSVVGRVRVSDGKQEVVVHFIADEEQARGAGYEMPEGLRPIVDRLYALAAKQVGEKEIRP